MERGIRVAEGEVGGSKIVPQLRRAKEREITG